MNFGAIDSATSAKVSKTDMANPQKSSGLSQGAQVGINMGLSAIGGIMQAKAAQKAQERQFQQNKQNQELTISQRKAQTQMGLLDSLAANLANTMVGG